LGSGHSNIIHQQLSFLARNHITSIGQPAKSLRLTCFVQSCEAFSYPLVVDYIKQRAQYKAQRDRNLIFHEAEMCRNSILISREGGSGAGGEGIFAALLCLSSASRSTRTHSHPGWWDLLTGNVHFIVVMFRVDRVLHI
jgi:hypothetical protein